MNDLLGFVSDLRACACGFEDRKCVVAQTGLVWAKVEGCTAGVTLETRSDWDRSLEVGCHS